MDRKLPAWASAPPPGYPGAIPPPGAKAAAGWQNGEEPPAGTFNWVFQAVSDVDNEVANAIVGTGGVLDGTRTDQLLGTIRRGRAVQAMTALRVVKDIGSGTLKAIARARSTGTVVVVGAAALIRSGGKGADFVARTAASPFVNDFNDVVYDPGMGLFLAVGNSGEIQSSPDGTAWTRRASAGSNFYAIASSGAGLAVTVGSNDTKYSTNGTTWTPGTGLPTTTVSYVAWVQNGFIALTDAGEVYRSVNGATWSLVLDAAVSGEPGVKLVHDPTVGAFVHVGPNIHWSLDGITWTQIHDSVPLAESVFVAPYLWGTTVSGALGIMLNGRTAVTNNRPADFVVDYLALASMRWFDAQVWALSGSKILVGGSL